MSRNLKGWAVVWIMTVPLFGAAEEPHNQQLTVFVAERAGTPAGVLAEAERNAAKVFHSAGVDIGWINCDEKHLTEACQKVHQADLIVHLVPRAGALSGDIFGVAFIEQGVGVYADVFFGSIQRLHEQDGAISLSPILGDVLSHEVGHLLLGSNSHSKDGIMQPHWSTQQLRQAAMGRLRFNKDQAEKIRNKILLLPRESRGKPALALVTQ